MYDVSAYSIIAFSLALAFGLIGAVQLAGPRFVRDAYARWDYAQNLRGVTGALDIAAAIMLAAPAMRGWGIALAAILTFGSVLVFLSHRQYAYALPTIGLMVALVPATAAIPRSGQVQFIVQRQMPAEAGMQIIVASSDAEHARAPQSNEPSGSAAESAL